MGARMAENLRRAGHDLVVHDSSIARLEEFSEQKGVQSVSSPAAVAEEEGGEFPTKACPPEWMHAMTVS